MQILNPQEFWDLIPTEESKYWPVICVDLNGVLDEYKGWNGKLEYHAVAEGAEQFLKDLRDIFSTIVILTATMPLDFAIKWMEDMGLDQHVDFITNHKVPAAVYLDDRAVTFKGNFKDALDNIVLFKPYWKTEK